MPDPTQTFTIGALRFDFEPWTGWVRHVRFRDTELVNAAYCGVRTTDWGTCGVIVRDLRVNEFQDGVTIRLSSEAVGMPFVWQTVITATSDGLEYRILGSPTTDMATRRTGLCVLHPTGSLQGSVVQILGGTGSVRWRAFPDLVMPGAPFEDFAALRFSGIRSEPRLSVDMAFTGDQFSSEDQRNWTDASLKTYCHPQSKGRIYTIAADERIDHKVSISLSEAETGVALGTWVSKPEQMADEGFERVSNHRLAFLAYRLSIEGYQNVRDAGLASHLYVDAASPIPSGDWPVALSGDRLVIQGRDWSTLARSLDEWRSWADDRKLTVALGSPGSFVELNRNRPPLKANEAVAFGMNASVHSADARSILETPQGARDCVRTAMTLGGNGEVLLGPVQISSQIADAVLRRSLLDLLVKAMPPNVLITAYSFDGRDSDAWG